jgi:DNA-binding PucR family transcriptional regulator
VDNAVWNWVKSFLMDLDVLTDELERRQNEKAEANKPLYNRLAVVDRLLQNNQEQLERVLDLYISGKYSREILLEREMRLKKTVAALKQEQADLSAHLGVVTLTDEQIETVTEFAKRVGRGLEKADQDFAIRRSIIDVLNVQVVLVEENKKKVAYVSCELGEDVLPVVPNTIGGCCTPSQSDGQ